MVEKFGKSWVLLIYVSQLSHVIDRIVAHSHGRLNMEDCWKVL